MAQKDLILAIDNGTQSLKAIVFNGRGDQIAKEQIGFDPYYSPQPGWAEQNPEVFWNTLCQACQSLWKQNQSLKDRLCGVTLTTQRATVINVDKQGLCRFHFSFTSKELSQTGWAATHDASLPQARKSKTNIRQPAQLLSGPRHAPGW